MTALAGFMAVVPAGGAGKRLWPVSRPEHPKFLLDLTAAGRTLAQQTWDRLEPLTGSSGILVVTGPDHAPALADQLPGLKTENILVEPSPRDSLPAIALAAAVAERRHGDVVLGSFAADHVIGSQDQFEQAVTGAYLAAREGLIATIGIRPTAPSTAYGYIKAGPSLGLAADPTVRSVETFKEKPDLATAVVYLQNPDYWWNAGMFVFQVRVLLRHLERLHPTFAQGINQLADAWDTPQRDAVAQRIWPTLDRTPIDLGIAEPVAAEGGMACVPGDFPWSDLGDFDSLAEVTPEGPNQVRVLGLDATPQVVGFDSPGALVVSSSSKVIALLGMPDVVVVDTPDAFLVTTRDQVQQVKKLADSVPRLSFTPQAPL
ncbi:MAG: NTP transferase domain-containing protein [Bifidobacteriaceae bacterium]|jgi:mannose-1-phosphate guanylyltransferase|nr:NTP transferase domain-containing protein [Bifidobacteriaceae bacterium]